MPHSGCGEPRTQLARMLLGQGLGQLPTASQGLLKGQVASGKQRLEAGPRLGVNLSQEQDLLVPRWGGGPSLSRPRFSK